MPIIFNKPIYLSLWLLVPVIWIMLSRAFAGGIWSRPKIIAGGLRSLLIIILGLALSDPQHMSHSDQVNVIFCLDVSQSIPRAQKSAAEAFIRKAAELKLLPKPAKQPAHRIIAQGMRSLFPIRIHRRD